MTTKFSVSDQNMIKTPIRILQIFICLLISSNAWGKDSRWYGVELILFEHLDKTNLNSESWPSSSSLPDYLNTKNRIRINTLKAQAFPLQPYPVIPYEKRKLQEEFSLLKRSKNFRPIFYRAWYQSMQRKSGQATIYIEIPDDLADTPNKPSLLDADINNSALLPELEGTLRITIGKYLHVYTDLLFRQNVQVPIIGNSTDETTASAPLGYTTKIQSYKINSHRSMRSKKLHYIDHPAIGALILFTPYHTRKAPEEAEEVANPLANLKKGAETEEETEPSESPDNSHDTPIPTQETEATEEAGN